MTSHPHYAGPPTKGCVCGCQFTDHWNSPIMCKAHGCRAFLVNTQRNRNLILADVMARLLEDPAVFIEIREDRNGDTRVIVDGNVPIDLHEQIIIEELSAS